MLKEAFSTTKCGILPKTGIILQAYLPKLPPPYNGHFPVPKVTFMKRLDCTVPPEIICTSTPVHKVDMQGVHKVRLCVHLEKSK